MENGLTPTEACLKVAKRIIDRTKEKRNLDAKGRPNFDVKLYALRKDGAYGSACLFKGGKFSVNDGTGARAYAWPHSSVAPACRVFGFLPGPIDHDERSIP